MRRFALLVLMFTLPSCAARGAACISSEHPKTAGVRWQVDHSVYDASLHSDWEVLVNCDHPDAPARMELVPVGKESEHGESGHVAQDADSKITNWNNASRRIVAPVSVRAGEVVEVSNAARASVSISMRGIAMQTAFPGQKIRVRLTASGRFIYGVVRGPHLIELVAPGEPSWGKR